jgi:threonine/homoserine/homoserine lactone efflux protein
VGVSVEEAKRGRRKRLEDARMLVAGVMLSTVAWWVAHGLGPIEWVVVCCWCVVAGACAYRWLRPSNAERQFQRLSQGMCPMCGYDLKGEFERCPECGRVLSAAELELARPQSRTDTPQ